MSSVSPPPRLVEKFTTIWKDWLNFQYEHIISHTGNSSPTSPTTGTNWNAHGDTTGGTGPFTVTGSLTTQELVPDTDDTYDIGTAALRYQDIFGTGAEIHKGDGTAITTGGSVFGETSIGSGGVTAANLKAEGYLNNKAAFCSGLATNTGATGSSTVGAEESRVL